MSSYHFLKKSFLKMILHCYKYPHLQVIGILVGSINGEVHIIEDVFPVTHGSFLLPSFELSLMMIEEHCKDRNLEILGCYCANELITQTKLNTVTKLIGNKINDNCNNDCIMLLNNTLITCEDALHSVDIYEQIKDNNNNNNKNNNKNNQIEWTEIDAELTFEDTIKEELKERVDNQEFLNLVDFDNHFDNPFDNNWLNLFLN
eukprot:TRINITY_DN1163_c0_g3_i1.p1 TRINITY_DN1163_c0_g3~~TRINITY_DN1163_c0_g3_i1.p1  ORF type:complete len:203 (+),score=39.61 TRINITY_DN1163_c0_g3_i1:247-855(+)